MYLDNFLEIVWIANAFKGIKVGVGILILNAAITMIKKMHNKKIPRMIMVGSCICMVCINLFSLKFSSISLMIIAATISVCLFMLDKISKKGGAK
jgi:chromate transporter